MRVDHSSWHQRTRSTLRLLAVQGLWVLGACTSSVTGEKLFLADMDNWGSTRNTLPVEFHGRIPGVDQPELARTFPASGNQLLASTDPKPALKADSRIVFYFDPGQLPSTSNLCVGTGGVDATPQTEDSTRVVAVLCRADIAISRASGQAILAGQPSAVVHRRLEPFIAELQSVSRPERDPFGGSR